MSTTKRAPRPSATKPVALKAAAAPKKPSKADRLIQMLQRKNGASIEELVAEFSTQPHSLRAQISVEKRKRGLTVALSEGRYRVL